MNEQLQKSLSMLENIIRIQKDTVSEEGCPEYMHGMLNGLICAHSCLTGDRPMYYTKPVRHRRKHVRHKSQLLKKGRYG